MYIRQDLGTTLTDLHTTLLTRDETGDSVIVDKGRVDFRLDANDPSFVFGDKEVPVTEAGLVAFGDHLNIPTAFLKRLNKSVGTRAVDPMLQGLWEHSSGDQVKAVFSEAGLLSLDDPRATEYQPHRLVDSVRRVLDNQDSPVTRLVDDKGFFGFDTVVPMDDPRTIGDGQQVGEGENRVNDLTSTGVRVGLDLKHGLAPFTQPYAFRLWCTNGCSSERPGLKVDARGQTIDEVMVDFEAMCRRAFAQAERDVQHFYELRNQRVDNPERAIRAIGREQNIPDRSIMRLIDNAATEDMPDEATMFDVVNLVTNLANAPSVTNDGGRRLLEVAGGNVIAASAARCGHCQQVVA